jgi:hypothetical protein
MNSREDHSIVFPLGAGGPFYRLRCSLRLINEGRQPLGRQIFSGIGLTWVPLLLLCWLQPLFLKDGAGLALNEDLLTHIPTYARFFVSLPLLILSETAVRARLEKALSHALVSGVVSPKDRQAYIDLLARALKWQESKAVEIALLLLALFEAQAVAELMRELAHGGWTLMGSSLSWAGMWYFGISKPFLQFLMFRWLFRLLIWWRVLYGVARLDLIIKPAHPDRRGGLAFIGDAVQAFFPLALAFSASVAGAVADYVLSSGTTEIGLKGFIAGGAGFIFLIFTAPLFFFITPMVEAKDKALFNYEGLAQRYCQVFDEKWNNPHPGAISVGELAAPEFSSITDMNAMVRGVREMTTLPFTREGLVPLFVAILLPFIPVLALAVPLQDILKGVLHVFIGGGE